MNLYDVRIIHRPKDGQPKVVVAVNDVLAKSDDDAKNKVLVQEAEKVKGVLDECEIQIRPFRVKA